MPMSRTEREAYIADQMRDREFAQGWNEAARQRRKAAASDVLAAAMRPALRQLARYMGSAEHPLVSDGERALEAYDKACRYRHPATPRNVEAGRGAGTPGRQTETPRRSQ